MSTSCETVGCVYTTTLRIINAASVFTRMRTIVDAMSAQDTDGMNNTLQHKQHIKDKCSYEIYSTNTK